MYLGSGCGLLYNGSICLYYLATVKYKKKDEYITKKFEPWLHGVSMFIPLVCCIVLLATQNLNRGDVQVCGYPQQYNPPHCFLYEDGITPDGYVVPCGRGDELALDLVGYIIILPILFGAPFVISVIMTLMYRAVSKTEKKMQKYGIGALRLKKTNLAVQSGRKNDAQGITNETNEEGSSKLKSLCKKCFASCKDSQQPASRSNKAQSQSKVICYRALAYSIA